MNIVQEIQKAIAVKPGQMTASTAITGELIDTQSLGQSPQRAQIALYLDDTGTADADITELWLLESDESGFSPSNVVPGSQFGIDSGTLPLDDDYPEFVAWNIDLQARKRYLKVHIKDGAGSKPPFIFGIALLGDLAVQQSPASQSQGAAQTLNV
jgi:hypothetical protein